MLFLLCIHFHDVIPAYHAVIEFSNVKADVFVQCLIQNMIFKDRI